MRIAVVGPTHPFKGGVAAHTTETARRLAGAGHEVELVSWARLYPRLLYPGDQAVPGGEPDLPPYEPTVRPLRWDRPGSWWRTGRRLRDRDLVVVVVVVAVQVPALLALVRALRTGSRRDGTGSGPRVMVLAHNVIPHEAHPGAAWLMGRMLRAGDGVLVHSAELARQASGLGGRDVRWVSLPPHLPGGPPPPRTEPATGSRDEGGGPDLVRVLALGMVRHYKGFDLLLQAARAVPGVSVTVAGELWGAAGERVRTLAADPALAGRVRLLAGYLPGARIPDLVRAHDVLALPYREATGSQNVLLGHAYGLPVLASTAGTFPEQVHGGVDGLLVPPGDLDALAGALRALTDPVTLKQLRDGVPEVDLDRPWQAYLDALTSAGAP